MQSMDQQATDKHFLQTIADNNYDVPKNTDAFSFAQALLTNFASTDGQLRDELSYMILANGIIDKQKLTEQQLEHLLLLVQDDNHLFYRIGEVDTDSVFMRSFSNLAIAGILYEDAKHPTLPEQTLQQTKEALLRYAQEERDWRGYVLGKGWAHAMAHLADSLDMCAQSQSTSEEDRQAVMQTVRDLAMLAIPLYNEEDTRLATVAHHIVATKEVDDVFLSKWLASCFVQRGPDISSWTRATNMKNFLRSLYFLLLWDNMAVGFIEQISNLLKRLDEVYI